jgi:uncharacterized protein
VIAILIVGVLVLMALLVGPQIWVRSVMQRHAVDRPDLPGTGGDLARHLLDLADLRDVKVELTGDGDHYDPEARAVRLSPDTHDGRTVTAVAVAVHEVGHALQDKDGDPMLAARLKLARLVLWLDRAAIGVMLLAPVVFAFVKAPALLGIQVAFAFALMGGRVLVHLVTLPVEFDASFRRALPIIETGGFLPRDDLPAARQVLRAAALTYVAAAALSLIDVLRWIRLLR